MKLCKVCVKFLVFAKKHYDLLETESFTLEKDSFVLIISKEKNENGNIIIQGIYRNKIFYDFFKLESTYDQSYKEIKL